MSNKIAKIYRKILSFTLMVFFLIGVFGVGLFVMQSSTLKVYADAESDLRSKLEDCESTTQLSVTTIFDTSNFVPVIPNECAAGEDGIAKPLSLNAVPVIIVRSYGLLASLVFYLFTLNLIFSGVVWSYGAFDEKQASSALQKIQESGTSVVLVLIAHIVVSTVFGILLGPNSVRTDINTISEFFTQ